MSVFVNILLLSLIFSVPILGQYKLPKVTSTDKSIISKTIIQKRDIRQYYDGGAFRCGGFSPKNQCDYEKLRKIIWQCWSEKTLCYSTISWNGVDAGGIEYIFIEPNKKNQWLIIRRSRNWHAVLKVSNKLQNLPLIYSVDWSEKDGKKILLLKDNLGAVIGEY